jgi:outer membrane protein TolC
MRTSPLPRLLIICVSLWAAAPRAQEIDTRPARQLTLDEALDLAKRNNRDLLAARERLKISYADVERAYAVLLPRLTAQGRFTVNHPEVRLDPNQLGGGPAATFGQLAQQGALIDVAAATRPAPQFLSSALRDYCMNRQSDPNYPAVQKQCEALNGQFDPNLVPQNSQGVANLLAGRNADGTERADTSFALVPRTQLDATITLTLPILAPPAYAAVTGARRAYRAQEKQLLATEAQLLQSVASAFFAAAGSDELVAARRHAIEVASKTLDNARARLEAGVVNRVEVTRAELALIQAQQRLLEAEDGRGAAYRVLATLILLREPFKVVPPQEPLAEGRSDGELVTQALRQRPEVPALEATLRAAESQSLSQALRWLPTLSAFGNARFTNATGFAGRVDTYAAGLSLDWTLFDGFERDAQRHVFAAQAADARLRLKQLRDTIADEVQNARRQLSTRREGLKVAQRSVQLAQETLDLVRIQHDAGTATQLDLLTAQDQLILAEVALAQARFDLSLSDVGLRRLIGSPFGTKER